MDLLFSKVTEDLVLSNGDLEVISDRSKELAQRLFIRFKTFKREWFFNLDYGVDYLNDVFGVNRSKNSVDILFRNEILNDVLTDEILSFKSSIKNYKYECYFTVSLIDEDTSFDMYILVNENGIVLQDNNNNTLVTLF